MSKHKVAREEWNGLEREARKLLRSPRFFNKFLHSMKKAGLIGEEPNALVLLVVAVSRVLPRPLNAFVKGHSSAGKNWLVTRLLLLMPRSAVVEITSASDKAWNYSHSDFRNRVLYVQERNEAAGTLEEIRTLISEGKLIRIVSAFENGKRVTKKYVTDGPVSAISTTTKNTLQIDDETRHVSIWVDESNEQTRRIVKSYARQKERLSRKERRTWHMVHRLLEKRVGTKIVFPDWFDEVADRLFVDDLRVRRYYPAFVEACRTVCLIRSFQPERKCSKHGALNVDFADFAITALIFDPVFVESLHLNRGSAEDTRRLVEEMSARKKRSVEARDIAHKMKISMDKAYARLRYAARIGAIQQANKPQRSNRKAYLSMPRPRFVPDPEKLFQELRGLEDQVRFVHPFTGKRVTYRRAE